MVGAAMGTTALSSNGCWWAVPVSTGQMTRFWLIDTENGHSDVFLEKDTIGHPQFCPDDDNLILYAGPMSDRFWVTDRSGRQDRRIHERSHSLQWVTHEVWRPNHRSVLFVDWPTGICEIDIDTCAVRRLSDFPVWHGAPDRTEKKLVCDTNFPDRGLHLLELKGAPSHPPRFFITRKRVLKASTGPSPSHTEMAQLRYMPPSIHTRIHVFRTMAGRSSLLQIEADMLRFMLQC